MCCDRINNSSELWCFKVTYNDGVIKYYVDSSMGDAANSAGEFGDVQTIEYIGEGAIGV